MSLLSAKHVFSSSLGVKKNAHLFVWKSFASIVSEERLQQCYSLLNVPEYSKQEAVRKAYLDLAKKYHPDSGSDEADIDKFCAIEDAFRVITKHNTGSTKEADRIEYDIKHTAPQHRQYLSYDGVGHGAPMVREKQWLQVRAQKAADNIMEHRISKAIASENTLMKKESVSKKHDIKTRYGFDRLVEDLIQESMSKGEFDNLSGKGKPLKGQNYNPFVDFTTHKLNEVLISNGFTPEWITLNKDIRQELGWLREELRLKRLRLGPPPLSDQEQARWEGTCNNYREFCKKVNSKILTFNLIVPLMNKQMTLVNFDDICTDILQNGKFDSRGGNQSEDRPALSTQPKDEALVMAFKAVADLVVYMFSFAQKKSNKKTDI